jgi:hypothetical protein
MSGRSEKSKAEIDKLLKMPNVIKGRKLTSIHSNYQSPNIVSYFFVSFLQSEKKTFLPHAKLLLMTFGHI